MKQRIIELSYNNHEEMFDLPINPSEFEFSEAQNNQKITLLNIGEANLIGHRGLVTGSLSSFFPSPSSPLARYAVRKLNDVQVQQTGCIGMCEKEVLVDIVRPGEPRITYGKVKPEDVKKIIAEHVVNGRIVEEMVVGKIMQD